MTTDNDELSVGDEELDALEAAVEEIEAQQGLDEAVGGGMPGTEDVLVAMGSQQTQSLAILLMTGSEKPEEFLMRGRLTQKDVMDLIEMVADENEVMDGDTDILGIVGLKANASAGADGQARKEAIQANSGGMMDPITGALRRFAGRRRRNYNQNWNANQGGPMG